MSITGGDGGCVFVLDELAELSRAPSAGEEAGGGRGGAAISYPCVVKHHLGEERRGKSPGVLSHRSLWPESQAHTGVIRGTCTTQSFRFGEAGAFRSKGVVLEDCR